MQLGWVNLMKKVDYKKDFKSLYLPKTQPEIVVVPEATYLMIKGEGNPNEEDFTQCVEALYTLSYLVKMSYKNSSVPEGYYEYKVFPLEGIWDLIDKMRPSTDKSNYKYTIMIRQPDFLTKELFEQFLEVAKKKKKNPKLKEVVLDKSEDGLCVQIMHIGPFEEEPISFKKMEQFCEHSSYRRRCKTHREIYLSDPRKTTPEKMKTVLRFKAEKL
jgi:hypothetical protein